MSPIPTNLFPYWFLNAFMSTHFRELCSPCQEWTSYCCLQKEPIQAKLQQPCQACTLPHPLFPLGNKGNRGSVPALHWFAIFSFCWIHSFPCLVLINAQDKSMENDHTQLRISSTVCHEAKEYFCTPTVVWLYQGENMSCFLSVPHLFPIRKACLSALPNFILNECNM